ncbi:MAG: ROK family transcriptional regulator [Candidatus Omnitrophota bacterium]|nr:ROK family transcriptional regulator [Candidatus Omnitrophota bacterium]
MRAIDFQKEGLSEKERRNIDILEILRRRGPVSRPDISKEMGVNVVTVSNYIDEFIRRNLVHEKDFDVSEGGRRPVLLDLNPQAAYVIGAGLNLLDVVGILIDLKGNIITKTRLPRNTLSAEGIGESLLNVIREVLRRSKEYASNIKGVGVGLAGLINKQDGSVRWPERSGATYRYAAVDVHLKSMLEKEFSLPTLIENDATCACFGEHWLDLEHGLKNVLYMFSGVGCGMMINGEVYRGAQGYAGEVAIYNDKEKEAFSCAAGRDCFIRRWEADLGIVEDVLKALSVKKDEADKFLKVAAIDKIEDISLKNVFSAARSGNAAASGALASAAERLGIKIASLVNLLNPQVAVIGGGLEEAGHDFLNIVDATVKKWAFREVTANLKIVYSQLRENAVAVGAASLVMQKIFSQL